MLSYIVTESEKQAVLRELELEKVHSPNAMQIPRNMTPAEEQRIREAVEAIHRRFHYIVCKLLS